MRGLSCPKRSATAAEWLQNAWFADVTVLRGGMEQRCREGFSVAEEADTSG